MFNINDNFQAFHLFDGTGDGEIENQYLEDALRVLGHNPKDDDIAAFRAKQFASCGTIRKLLFLHTSLCLFVQM